MALDGRQPDDGYRREEEDSSSGAEKKHTKTIDYSSPVSVVGAILDEVDCTNPFTRSRVFIVVSRVLSKELLSLEEACRHIRFDGPDDFCSRFGAQEELPTTPSTPSSMEQHRTISTDTLRAVETPTLAAKEGAAADGKSPTSVTGTLLIDIQMMTAKVNAAFAEGAAPTSTALSDESATPSSRRFPKAKP